MRGRRKTLAAALAETLATRPEAATAALAAAFAEACGPRLAREAAMRGVMRDGRILVLVTTREWGVQLSALEAVICERVNARLGRLVANGLDVRVGPVR